jgi:hypothetical protein
MSPTRYVEHLHNEDQFREPNLPGSVSLMQVTPLDKRVAQSPNLRPKTGHFCNATLPSAFRKVLLQRLMRRRRQSVE